MRGGERRARRRVRGVGVGECDLEQPEVRGSRARRELHLRSLAYKIYRIAKPTGYVADERPRNVEEDVEERQEHEHRDERQRGGWRAGERRAFEDDELWHDQVYAARNPHSRRFSPFTHTPRDCIGKSACPTPLV